MEVLRALLWENQGLMASATRSIPTLHKCGHAVIAILKNIEISNINIDSSTDLDLCIETDEESVLDASEFGENRTYIESCILVSLTGYTATLKLRNKRLTSPVSHHYWDMLKSGCQDDLNQAKRLIALLSPTPREEDVYLQYYLYRARAIWDETPAWLTLSILADKLIAARLILASDAKFICETVHSIAVSFEDYRSFTGAPISDIKEHLIGFKGMVQGSVERDTLYLEIIDLIERSYPSIANQKPAKVKKGFKPTDHVA